jgi:hypothetical protein
MVNDESNANNAALTFACSTFNRASLIASKRTVKQGVVFEARTKNQASG